MSNRALDRALLLAMCVLCLSAGLTNRCFAVKKEDPPFWQCHWLEKASSWYADTLLHRRKIGRILSWVLLGKEERLFIMLVHFDIIKRTSKAFYWHIELIKYKLPGIADQWRKVYRRVLKVEKGFKSRQSEGHSGKSVSFFPPPPSSLLLTLCECVCVANDGWIGAKRTYVKGWPTMSWAAQSESWSNCTKLRRSHNNSVH